MSGRSLYRAAEVARVSQILMRWQHGRYSYRVAMSLMGLSDAQHDVIAERVTRTMPWDDLQRMVYTILYPDEYPRLTTHHGG